MPDHSQPEFDHGQSQEDNETDFETTRRKR